MDWQRVTRERIAGCEQLVLAASDWLGPLPPVADRTWTAQRSLETTVRALRTVQSSILLARADRWEPVYVLARNLFEDVVIVHWLVTHPDPETLERKFDEHLLASQFADYKSQLDLGLELDPATVRWSETVDLAAAEQAAQRFQHGRRPWTGKSFSELISGITGRGLPGRDYADERVRYIDWIARRLLLPMNLAMHHSAATAQNWVSPAHEMLPDALRMIYLSFGLLLRLAIEDFAPDRLDDFHDVLEETGAAFWQPNPSQCAETDPRDPCPCGSGVAFVDCHAYACPD